MHKVPVLVVLGVLWLIPGYVALNVAENIHSYTAGELSGTAHQSAARNIVMVSRFTLCSSKHRPLRNALNINGLGELNSDEWRDKENSA